MFTRRIDDTLLPVPPVKLTTILPLVLALDLWPNLQTALSCVKRVTEPVISREFSPTWWDRASACKQYSHSSQTDSLRMT